MVLEDVTVGVDEGLELDKFAVFLGELVIHNLVLGLDCLDFDG